MKPSPVIWKLSFLTPPRAQEAVAKALESEFGASASIYTDLAEGKTTVDLYLQRKPAWSRTTRSDLGRLVARITGLEPDKSQSGIRLTRLGAQDWSQSWKRHFKPLQIGARLLLRPSWSRRRAGKDCVEVVLDPGLSFGTGQHPTTHFCLSELVRHRADKLPQSFLDIGTGSGILAISARKLGYGPVEAFDLDKEAVKVARANARLNRVSATVGIRCQDLAKLPPRSARRYSIVCANLISDVLLTYRDLIVARLLDEGVLVLAGILDKEFHSVQAAYEAAGLRLVRSRKMREWRSGSFRKGQKL
jgi:ribosomal protein L11 methyltransferase